MSALTALTNGVLTANSVLTLVGLVVAAAALVGLALQQEIPQEWLDRLRSIATWCVFGFAVFASWRWGRGEYGWMALGYADAFLFLTVLLTTMGLVLRDEEDVEIPEPLDDQAAYLQAATGNGRVIPPMIVESDA